MLHPAQNPVEQRYIESFNNRLRRECLNRSRWTNPLEDRVVMDDFNHEHNHRHRHSALGYLPPRSRLPDAATLIAPWPIALWPVRSNDICVKGTRL
ncbi:integrase core domain-containing protein [Mycobacterium liflandii]|uniref:integrase core domain-containing protein n=1 Tax=Mycobacterium ulcerans group TaxID=2993898 RepID=UPI00399442E4